MIIELGRAFKEQRSSIGAIAVCVGAVLAILAPFLTVSMADPPRAENDEDDGNDKYQLYTAVCSSDESLFDVRGMYPLSDTTPIELNIPQWFKCPVNPHVGRKGSTMGEDLSLKEFTTQPTLRKTRYRKTLSYCCLAAKPLTLDVNYVLTDLQTNREMLSFSSKVKFTKEDSVVVLSTDKGKSIMLLRLTPYEN